MASDLKEELKQKRPFRSIREEAQLNVARTANMMSAEFEQMFRPFGITGTQYNVLRILRGAGPAGLCRNEVSQRLLNRMPDATRLLDRMEEAGLVTRARASEDRRLVTTQLTGKGRDLVNSLDDEVERQHEVLLGHMAKDELRALIELLTRVRNRE